MADLNRNSEDGRARLPIIDRDGKRVCELDAEELGKKFESGDVSTTDSASSKDSEKTRFSFMKELR